MKDYILAYKESDRSLKVMTRREFISKQQDEDLCKYYDSNYDYILEAYAFVLMNKEKLNYKYDSEKLTKIKALLYEVLVDNNQIPRNIEHLVKLKIIYTRDD